MEYYADAEYQRQIAELEEALAEAEEEADGLFLDCLRLSAELGAVRREFEVVRTAYRELDAAYRDVLADYEALLIATGRLSPLFKEDKT